MTISSKMIKKFPFYRFLWAKILCGGDQRLRLNLASLMAMKRLVGMWEKGGRCFSYTCRMEEKVEGEAKCQKDHLEWSWRLEII